LANVGEYYTQQTWQAGVTPLSEAALNNIDAGIEGVQKQGVIKNGTNIAEDKTLPSGENYLLVAPITIDSGNTLTVEGRLKIL
jgi:hypothetical protein